MIPTTGSASRCPNFRYSQDDNFSGTVNYEHPNATGAFELQISYRLEPILEPRALTLVPQGYFARVECGVPELFGIDPYEMIGEKLMACNPARRLGQGRLRPLSLEPAPVRHGSRTPPRRPQGVDGSTRPAPLRTGAFLARIQPANFRWEDIQQLVPRGLPTDRRTICDVVRDRFGFFISLDADERVLLDDQTAHREVGLFEALRADAQGRALTVVR